MDLPRDFNLLRRIAPRGREVSSRTGFSLCTVAQPQLKPHRLKPVLLERAGAVCGKTGRERPQISCEKCALEMGERAGNFGSAKRP